MIHKEIKNLKDYFTIVPNRKKDKIKELFNKYPEWTTANSGELMAHIYECFRLRLEKSCIEELQFHIKEFNKKKFKI